MTTTKTPQPLPCKMKLTLGYNNYLLLSIEDGTEILRRLENAEAYKEDWVAGATVHRFGGKIDIQASLMTGQEYFEAKMNQGD